MSILSVDTIQPIGSGSTVTLNAAKTAVGTGITFESNGQAIYAGIITATSFSGSGANLTSIPAGQLTGTVADARISTLTSSKLSGALPAISGANLTSLPAQASISNNADNRVITGGSGVNLNGEANLIYNGTGLGVGETSPANLLHVKVSDAGIAPHGSAQIVLERSGTNYLQFLTAANGTSGLLFGDTNDIDVAKIVYDHNIPAMQFQTEGAERLRITSGGTLYSYSPDDATPNIALRSNDTNWHGYLTQTVEGGSISSILSCGGKWNVDGTTYAATKDLNGSFSTGALVIHNQYNGNQTGAELVFLSKANGSSTTDGTVSERLRITRTGQVTKPASCAFNVTHNGSQNYGSAGTHTITSWKTTDSRGFENTTTGGYFGSGIFTAPVTGAYFFTSTLLLKDMSGTNGVHVWWSKNNSVHSYWETRFNGSPTGYGNYEPVSGQCTMYMSAGDTCRIKINFSGSSCGIHGDDQNWGNWGGFLIG